MMRCFACLLVLLLTALASAADPDPEPEPTKRPKLPKGQKLFKGTVLGVNPQPQHSRSRVYPPVMEVSFRSEGGEKFLLQVWQVSDPLAGKPKTAAERAYRAYFKHNLKDVRVMDEVELAYDHGPRGGKTGDKPDAKFGILKGLRVVDRPAEGTLVGRLVWSWQGVRYEGL